MKKIIILATLLFLTGCGPQKPWIKAESVYTNQNQGFSVELPDGWMRVNNEDLLLTTRDGFPLQSIFVRSYDIGKNPLKNTKKVLRKDMLPMEVAEVVLDDTSSASSLTDVRTEENVPVTIGDLPGFRIVYTFRNKQGLKMKAILCGRLKDESLLVVRYTAPQRHYFDLDAATFEKVFQSLKLTEKKQ